MDLFAVIIQKVLQVNLRGIIGVWAENHAAVLPVKWEVRHLEIVKWKSPYHFEDDSQNSSKEEQSMRWYCFSLNEVVKDES